MSIGATGPSVSFTRTFTAAILRLLVESVRHLVRGTEHLLNKLVETLDRPGRFWLVFGLLGAVYLLFDATSVALTESVPFSEALFAPPLSHTLTRLIVLVLALTGAVLVEVVARRQRSITRALSAERARLQALYENNPSAVTILDKDFIVAYANKQVSELSGVPVERVVGDTCHHSIMGFDAPCDGCLVPQVLQTAQPHSRIKHELTAGGKENWLSQTWYPLLDESGEVEAVVEIASDVSALRLDPLTSLPNRILLRDRIDVALAASRRHGISLALLFLDVDGFKEINDTYGHAAGDLVLTGLAERLRGVVRQDETVGRLAGDEFLILLPKLDDAHDATRLAERVLEHLEAPFIVHGRETSVSVSIGVCVFSGDMRSAEELISCADEAMYVAKKSGRGRYHVARVGDL